MSQIKIDILQNAVNREKKRIRNLNERYQELYKTTLNLKQINVNLENLLIEKTLQIQGIYENISDAYIILDIQGDILKMNTAAIELLGYSIENETLNVMQFVYKGDYVYAKASYKALLKDGVFTNYEARITTKTKGVKWVHINASVIYDQKKNPLAVQGIIRDITKAKIYTEIIEEQKTQLGIIVDNSNLGIVLTQFGKILKTNITMQNFLGYTEDELSGLSIKDISFANDFQQSKGYIEKMDAGKLDNFVVDKRYKKKNGSVLWARTNVTAVRDSNGSQKYHVALIENIRSQREKTLMLDMVNDIAKAIIGKMDIYEIAWELTNNITKYLGSEDCVIYLVNNDTQTLEQIAAYGEKLLGERQIINKLSIPIGNGIVGSVAKTGNAEIINDTSKDKRYIVDVEKRYSEIAVPIITEGKVIGVIDSEHQDKDYYTKEHLHALENIASLVALQLKNAINLRERKKAEKLSSQLLMELEKSNQELQDYAHIVSHDLKSPLRSILALSSWIKEDYGNVIDDKGMENFKHIEDKIEKMDHLIDGILSYSSIGKKNVLEQKVDLNEVLMEITDIIYKPSHIEILIKKKLPIIKGDPTRFQQLFQNLISNAIKYIDKAEGNVEVDYIEDKTFYQFSVSDNGIGISKEYHKKVFEIFQSVSDGESTGIGLSIVKKIVTLYQGKIWVESQVNKGTTFFFTIKKQ